MKYNLFEINERLQNGEITSEQAFFIAGFSECIKYLEMQSNVSERKIVRCEDPMVCLRGCSVHEQTCRLPIYDSELCPNNEQHVVKKDGDNKYCMVCGVLK